MSHPPPSPTTPDQRTDATRGAPAPFKHILVPLDGSLLAAAAFTYAIGLARLCGAHVTLLMVIPPIEDVIEAPAETIAIDAQWKTRSIQARRYLASLCEHPECARVRLDTVVTTGSAADTILDYAEGHQADLIVMTTHGRSGLSRWVWGSVADKVLRAARMTVLLVRSGASEAQP